MSDQPTGVQLNAKLFILFILNMIFPLTVEVDGVPQKGLWGAQTLSLAPGTHQISAFYKWYWFYPSNKATLDVAVNPGELVPVRYKVRWFFFLPGKMYIDNPPAAAA